MEEFKRISVPGYLISNTGKVFSEKTGKFMKQVPNHDGYLVVGLRDSFDDQRHHTKFVHRLMAEAFLDGYEEGLEVDHIDRDKENNTLDNFRWVSRAAQMRNTRNNVYVSYQGHDHILKDICKKFKAPTLYANILSRVNRGKGTHQQVFELSIKGLEYAG